MKKLSYVATLLAVIGVLLISGVWAQTETTPGPSREPSIDRPTGVTPGPSPSERPNLRPSTPLKATKEVYTSDLIGAPVKNPQGENLGSLQELVLDPREAKITNAVVSTGGLLGIGARAVAVPWQDVTLEADGKTLVVAMGKEEISNAPEWKKPAEETKPMGREPTTSSMAPQQGAPSR
jgi:sporulation protein YlmC with PRC-barrel domain